MIIVAGAILGVLLSAYLLYVDWKVRGHKEYKAVCDITDTASCTAVARSEYSHVFGLPNAVLGLLYYVLVGILAHFGLYALAFAVSVPAILMTAYLAYVSYFRIRKICLVCHATYLINLAIFAYSIWRVTA